MIVRCSLISRFVPRSLNSFHTSSSAQLPKRWKEKTAVPFQSELRNPVAEVYGGAERWPDDEVFSKEPAWIQPSLVFASLSVRHGLRQEALQSVCEKVSPVQVVRLRQVPFSAILWSDMHKLLFPEEHCWRTDNLHCSGRQGRLVLSLQTNKESPILRRDSPWSGNPGAQDRGQNWTLWTKPK